MKYQRIWMINVYIICVYTYIHTIQSLLCVYLSMLIFVLLSFIYILNCWHSCTRFEHVWKPGSGTSQVFRCFSHGFYRGISQSLTFSTSPGSPRSCQCPRHCRSPPWRLIWGFWRLWRLELVNYRNWLNYDDLWWFMMIYSDLWWYIWVNYNDLTWRPHHRWWWM